MGAVIELALKMKNVIQAKAKEKQAEFHGNQYKSGLLQKSDKVQIHTDDELSKLAGVNLGGKGVSYCPVLGCHVSLLPLPLGSVQSRSLGLI